MATVEQKNLVVDGSFEFSVPDYWSYWDEDVRASAWTAKSQTQFEVWANGFNGQNAADGRNFIELDNGLAQDSYSQSIDTVAGQHYTFSVASMLRDGTAASTSGVELVWNGTVVKTFAPTDSKAWTDYTADVVGTGHDILTIREVAGQNDSVGALIDNVRLVADASIPVTPPVVTPPVDTPTDQAVFQDVAGPQWLDGKTANDIFVIDANMKDYHANRTLDGLGIVVWSGDKFDILTGFDTLRFKDGDVKADAKGDFTIPYGTTTTPVDPGTSTGGETIYKNTADNQFLDGTTAKDVFVIDGNSKDYNVVTAEDGKGVVVRYGDQIDVLHGFDVLRFNDKDVQADAKGQFDIHGVLNDKGEMIHTNTAGTQWMEGFSANDVYVVGGKSTDFQVGKCADNWGIIVWQGNDFDILYDVEVIRFDDKEILSSSIV